MCTDYWKLKVSNKFGLNLETVFPYTRYNKHKAYA